MNCKNIIGLLLLVTCLTSNAQTSSTNTFHVWSDQQVGITGEEIWVDGYLNQPSINAKAVTLRLVDRNGQTKSEVDVIPQRNNFSGFLSLPENLISDYYFIDCFVNGISSFSRLQPIMVINPRLAPQGNCQTSPLAATAMSNNTIGIKTQKDVFNPRSLVRVELELPLALDQLTFSAVAHDALAARMDSLSTLFPVSFNHNNTGGLENEGQVLSVTASKNGTPLKNVQLIVALKGTKAVVGNSTTNDNGVAKFILPLTYDARQLVVSTLGKNKEKINLTIGKTVSDQQLIQFPCLQLDESMRSAIENRMLNSRVTNRFYGVNTKLIETSDRDTSDFYGKPDIVFQLDDYVRFPNMEEVITEIIPQLRVKKNKEEVLLQVLNSPYKTFFEQEALLLLDGIPVQDSKAIIEADPLLIKSIEIVARKYMQGSTEYNGIVHFKTYRGDLANLVINNNDANFILNGVQETATFQNADHTKVKNRLPDLRNLLWREVNISSDQIKAGLKYYTSDAEGSFKIIARGINANKEMVKGVKLISVLKD